MPLALPALTISAFAIAGLIPTAAGNRVLSLLLSSVLSLPSAGLLVSLCALAAAVGAPIWITAPSFSGAAAGSGQLAAQPLRLSPYELARIEALDRNEHLTRPARLAPDWV